MDSERFANLRILSNIANRIQYDLNQFKEILDLELDKLRQNNDGHSNYGNGVNSVSRSQSVNFVECDQNQVYDAADADIKMEMIENVDDSIQDQQDQETDDFIFGNFDPESADYQIVQSTSTTAQPSSNQPKTLKRKVILRKAKGQNNTASTTKTTNTNGKNKIAKSNKPQNRKPVTIPKCVICKMTFNSREQVNEHTQIHFSIPTNYKFIASRRGNPLLQADDYIYFKNSQSNISFYWNCVKYKSKLCPGKAITPKNYTDPGAKITVYCEHNHPVEIQGTFEDQETTRKSDPENDKTIDNFSQTDQDEIILHDQIEIKTESMEEETATEDFVLGNFESTTDIESYQNKEDRPRPTTTLMKFQHNFRRKTKIRPNSISKPKRPAKIKTPTCNVCKVTFKSRELLVEHSKTHFKIPEQFSFRTSKQGNPVLNADGYSYCKNAKTSSSIYWACVSKRGISCPGRAITSPDHTGDIRVKLSGNHNHPKNGPLDPLDLM